MISVYLGFFKSSYQPLSCLLLPLKDIPIDFYDPIRVGHAGYHPKHKQIHPLIDMTIQIKYY